MKDKANTNSKSQAVNVGSFTLLVLVFSAVSCTVKVKSNYIESGLGSDPQIIKGIPYQLPSTFLTITGKYKVRMVKTVYVDEPEEEVEGIPREIYAAPLATDWAVAKDVAPDSQFTFSVDPDTFRTFTAALPIGTNSNMISLTDSGMLSGFNFKAEDKTGQILKNLLDAATNVAISSTGSGGIDLSKIKKYSPAGHPEAEEGRAVKTVVVDLGDITVKTTVSVKEAIEESIRKAGTHKGVSPGAFSQVRFELGEFSNQVRHSALVKSNSRLDDQVYVSDANLCMSADRLLTPVIVKRKFRELQKLDGIVARYPATAQVEVVVDGQKQFAALASVFEAGGFHHIPVKSRPFTTSEDKITYSTNGHGVSSYAYGREATGEKLSGSIVDVTGGTATAIKEYSDARDRANTAEKSRQSAIATARKNLATAIGEREKAQLDLDVAREEYELAERKRLNEGPEDPELIRASNEKKKAVVDADVVLQKAKVSVEAAEAELRLSQ